MEISAAVLRRILAVVGASIMALSLLVVGAEAKGTYNWYSSSSPLKATSGAYEAWGYGTWTLLDESSGLRSRLNANIRTKNGDSNNLAKAHLRTQTRNCTNCSWQQQGSTATSSYYGNSWVYRTVSHGSLPSSGTHARGEIRMTLDRRSLKPDAHSGWIYRGPSSY